jgi:hypothetical protein
VEAAAVAAAAAAVGGAEAHVAAAAVARRARRRTLLLANACLEHFARATRVAVASKAVALRMGRLKLVLGGCRRGTCRVRDGACFMDDGERPFTFSPAYARLSGTCVTAAVAAAATATTAAAAAAAPPSHTFAYTGAELDARRAELLGEMVRCFWAEAAARRYLPDAALRGEVSEYLLAYLGSGLRDQSTAFAPTGGGGGGGGGSPLFYLWGLPGIGKTTFATVFAASLEAVLQRFVDPERCCKIVKVPLNAVTPANLRAVLRVKGISDWSIERVLEQTIVRGDLALFHLEENPADHSLQLALHALIAKMLGAITRLYPERAAGCILRLCTSNYAPAEALARGARVVEMSPPGPERQRSWCEAELAVHLRSALGEAAVVAARARGGGGTPAPPPLDVQVTLAPAVMPQTRDLRALKKLVYTVAFAAAQHAMPAAAAAAATAAALLPASVLRLSLGPDVGAGKGAEGASSAAAAGEGEGVCGMVADMRWDPPAGDDTAPLAPLRLVSSDGFFFPPRRGGGGEAATAAAAGARATGEVALREAGWATGGGGPRARGGGGAPRLRRRWTCR